MISGMVHFGIPLWIGGVIKGYHEKLDIIKDKGLDTIELSIDYPWPYSEKELLIRVVETIKKNKLLLAIHAPWRDLPFSTPYSIIGNAIVKVLVENIMSLSEFLDNTYIVIHPFTMQRIELFNNRKDIITSTRNYIKELIKDLSSKGVEITILLENLTKGFASEISHLVEIIEGLDKTGICLDVGHLASRYNRELTNRYNDFYEYLVEVVEILNDINVTTIHIHDVDRNNKEHLLIGEGILQFKKIYKIISKLRPQYIIYEVFNSKKESLTFEKIIRNIEEQISWGKIYLH